MKVAFLPMRGCFTLLAACLGLLFLGCDQKSSVSKPADTQPAVAQNPSTTQPIAAAPASAAHVRVGYIGLTCEAPLFVAMENGFFKDEGLDPELIKCEWGGYKEALGLGKIDVTHHLVMYLLKPVEQGLDVKFTAGVHRGCLRIQAGTKTALKTVEDLKGKRIGVPAMGSPPFIFTSRVLAAHGMNPSKDVEWKQFPAAELGLALDKGLVDAVANADPIGTMLIEQGKAYNIVDQATDAPYADEYCCAVVVNGKFAAENPTTAAKATRAILKAAKWVQVNPVAAAKLGVEKKYLATNPDLNARALAKLKYLPSVAGGEAAVRLAATEMRTANLLNPTTDVDALVHRAFLHLDGVSDEWINSVVVNKVPGGDVLPAFSLAQLVAAADTPSCCRVPK